MSHPFFLTREHSFLLVVDIQERLFAHMDHACEFLEKALIMIKGCQALGLPILVTEQYPQGLGQTVSPIKKAFKEEIKTQSKTAFSAAFDLQILASIKALQRPQCILIGIEAHICVLQTTKDLLHHGFEVTIANDAISSRSLFDFSTAIAELRDCGARITSTETVLFELMRDAKIKEFKEVSSLMKAQGAQS